MTRTSSRAQSSHPAENADKATMLAQGDEDEFQDEVITPRQTKESLPPSHSLLSDEIRSVTTRAKSRPWIGDSGAPLQRPDRLEVL